MSDESTNNPPHTASYVTLPDRGYSFTTAYYSVSIGDLTETLRLIDRSALTTAQQLALSVLIGDESVLPQALADYLLDQGHEYATACYERGKLAGVWEHYHPALFAGSTTNPPGDTP